MRIMLFGHPGSGKTTTALVLKEQLDIPLYHLDKYFFKEHWQERNPVEFLEIQKKFVDQESWIIDGNAVDSFEMRYSRADYALYFRFSRVLCLLRILQRYFFKDYTIDDRAAGCPERISWKLIRYLWTYDQRVLPLLADLHYRYPGTHLVVIHNRKSLDRILELMIAWSQSLHTNKSSKR
jgi:adenylate kinase family enzyme